ncbi:hypothetical protein QFC21_006820 [Naganishia friedmannii]|uniref:Uncharacterized protein n=1 Tax=Naganishia friedmannii TaxID=89922 RepID=A0ACC2UZE5_9TREE|nr:hypothetical protein QFC21_006820 [Naganishia friedmannii]
MKFLDIPSLSRLSEALAYSSAECKVNARLEAYSCKEIKKERKLRKNLEEIWVSEVEELDELSISPEMKASGLYSPFGSLDDKHARQTHWLLVSTLNLAYPDHDFSSVRADQFQREPGGVQAVLGALSGVMNLGSNANGSSPRSYGSYPSTLQSPPMLSMSLGNTSTFSPPLSSMTHPTLLRVLGEVISLDDCVVYSYVPSPEADPHQEDIYDETADPDEDGDSSQRLTMDDEDDTMTDSYDEDDKSAELGIMLDFDEDDIDFGGPIGAGHGPRGAVNRPEDKLPSRRMSQPDGRQRGGLLWSVNYFFYCNTNAFLGSELYTNPFSHAAKIHHHPHGMQSLLGLASSISSTGSNLQTPHMAASNLPDRKHSKHMSSPVVQAASGRRQRSDSVASKSSAVDVTAHAVKRVRV